jgi:hypothetical protein
VGLPNYKEKFQLFSPGKQRFHASASIAAGVWGKKQAGNIQ